jgi:hypothetical protein
MTVHVRAQDARGVTRWDESAGATYFGGAAAASSPAIAVDPSNDSARTAEKWRSFIILASRAGSGSGKDSRLAAANHVRRIRFSA